jgi:hypothetical protein
MTSVSKGTLAVAMILIVASLSVASIYLSVLTRQSASEMQTYAVRREDLVAQGQSLEELISRLNATLVEDLSKEKMLNAMLAQALETKRSADEKRNVSTTERVINTTVIESAPVQIDPPKPAPRVTRAS